VVRIFSGGRKSKRKIFAGGAQGVFFENENESEERERFVGSLRAPRYDGS
jgi:hypothetical protein